MTPDKLIGKKAVRTKPCGGDNSYRRNPVKILKVTDTHIVIKHCFFKESTISLLTSEWIDDAWIDYDELIKIDKQDNKKMSFEEAIKKGVCFCCAENLSAISCDFIKTSGGYREIKKYYCPKCKNIFITSD